MPNDGRFESAVREYLEGATRALDRDDYVSTSLELIQALHYPPALTKRQLASDMDCYKAAWMRVANELSKLAPSLVRQAVRVIDGRSSEG